MNGILNIDKPAGMTSYDVVGRVRRLAKQKRVGHAGTLDPDATGVLLVCLGEATRLAEYLADAGKEYDALLVLGATTTTEDASGEVVTEADANHLNEADVVRVLPQFIGDIQQIPPMVSAVHHEGKRLYELARQGIIVEREARTVRVERIELSDFQSGQRPTARLEIACGKGTYIRTLCADIGATLGVGGHMGSLRRTSVGDFGVETAIPLDALTEETLGTRLVSPSEAMGNWPAQIASETEQTDIQHGRTISTQLADCEIVKITDAQNELLALARAETGTLRPFKVFSGR